MVSLDEPDRNKAFAESLGAEHVLLSDEGGAVGRSYGVVGVAGLYARRWTFYIDRDGRVRKVDKKVQVGSAGQDIARALGELGFAKRASEKSSSP